jgi:predicted transcriptional regulator
LLGRNEVDVLGDIDRLIELGLVDQSGEDYGTPYDELEIHLPLVAQAA